MHIECGYTEDALYELKYQISKWIAYIHVVRAMSQLTDNDITHNSLNSTNA